MRLIAEKATKQFIRNRQGSNVLTAVSETDLVLKEGTLTVLSGPSGSGKSTLLNMMAGLLPPDKGRILLDDTDLYSLDDAALSKLRNRHIGVIPQGQTALYALSVIENVMAPRILYQKPKGKDYEETFKYAGELLDRAGIADLSDVMPSELSGGEIRRMAVCRAMLLKPGIILADEPTGDLDEENTGTVMELLKDHVKAGGSVMVVTHDIQVRDYADILMEMKQGVIYPQ